MALVRAEVSAMCDLPTPCGCTLERRNQLRAEHIERSDAITALASRLRREGHVSDDEALTLYSQAEKEWDDAIHIASPDDPLRSLCGLYGRNLDDLPERPDGMSGCWTCLIRAEELSPAAAREMVTV